MNLVVDAGVALKWFLRDRQDEADVGPAVAILTGIDTGRYRLWQPPLELQRRSPALAASIALCLVPN